MHAAAISFKEEIGILSVIVFSLDLLFLFSFSVIELIGIVFTLLPFTVASSFDAIFLFSIICAENVLKP